MTQEDQPIELVRDGHVAIISFNRPTKLNAMTVAMDKTINEMVYEINNDDEIRSVVLHGRGGRAFSAGSDIIGRTETALMPAWTMRARSG